MRRHLLLSLLVALAALSASLWAFTCFRSIDLHYVDTVNDRNFDCFINDGSINLISSDIVGADAGWNFQLNQPGLDPIGDIPPNPFTLGFNAGTITITEVPPSHFITIPLWFLTTLSALFLIYVWRKTRPRPKPAAFPIGPHPPAKTPST